MPHIDKKDYTNIKEKHLEEEYIVIRLNKLLSQPLAARENGKVPNFRFHFQL